jgi:hypothetical protein
LLNNVGINWDSRGTKNHELEFNDYHSDWIVQKGIATVYDLANAFFKIKSHKFENWYEGVWSMDGFTRETFPKYTSNYIYTRVTITFSIDHGS